MTLTLYKYLFIILAVLGVAGTITVLSLRVKALNQEVQNKGNNIKSYEQSLQTFQDKNGNLHNQVIQMQQSMDELQASQGQADKALLDSLAKYKIKTKTITQAGQITTTLTHDTIVQVKGFRDTTINLSQLPYITNIFTIKSDMLSNQLEIVNTQTLAWIDKKETIAPPSNIFFIRWFQKKQHITEVDVINSNPYIHTINQHFTHIVK